VNVNQLSVVALLAVAGLTMVGLSRRIRQEDLSIRGDIAAPPAIEAILKRSCYDCHSNETRWPWYGYVAPFAWWLERDVGLGRKQLNFSDGVPITRRRRFANCSDRWTLHQETCRRGATAYCTQAALTRQIWCRYYSGSNRS